MLAGVPAARADVDGEQVRRAIARGVRAIRREQNPDGSWPDHYYPGGVPCLATLALLQAGEDPAAPHMAASLARIRRLSNMHTYVVSLKVMVLSIADPVRYRPEIEAGAQWLVEAQNRTGLWDYSISPEILGPERGEVRPQRFDHSNTQFALLGLHAASQAGVDIPSAVWKRAMRSLFLNQNADGGWSYQARGNSYGSMTAAGVSDLVILGGRSRTAVRQGPRNWPPLNCGKYRTSRALLKGLRWLSANFDPGSNPRGSQRHYHYWLYAVERAGILSGQRFFGRHDWYRAGAEILVKSQDSGGRWNRNLTDTCFGVLFLAKGHKALLVQKLQWSEGDAWAPVQYELANLLSFIGDRLEEPVTWQTVPIAAPVEEWLAAPLLYITGYTLGRWTPAERARLRAYCEQGGTVMAAACCGRGAFRDAFEELMAETFPEVPLRELGKDHAVYRVVHEVEPYGLKGIDLGCRTCVIYSPNDLPCLWEQGDVPQLSERAFQLGENIAAYAVGRRPLRDRLDAVVIPKPLEGEAQGGLPAQGAFRLGQVVYEGDWRPFPMAMVGLAEFLRDRLGFDVVTEPRQLRLTEADLYTSPVLFFAGHFDFALSAAEREALREHLRRGGFLIADACCGTEPFDGAFRRLMRETFPQASLERLPGDHPIVVGSPGFDVRRVQFTPDVERAQPNRVEPELWGLRIDGRLAVVYSPLSLSCGLHGNAFDGCWGYASEDARKLAANIVLYALTH
jgi:hypothetical protein